MSDHVHRVRPAHVLHAILVDNQPALSAMGKKSGRVRKLKAEEKARQKAELRAEKARREMNEAIYQEHLAEKLRVEFYERDEQANMHLCPLDDIPKAPKKPKKTHLKLVVSNTMPRQASRDLEDAVRKAKLYYEPS
jgi:hypothetical protein